MHLTTFLECYHLTRLCETHFNKDDFQPYPSPSANPPIPTSVKSVKGHYIFQGFDGLKNSAENFIADLQDLDAYKETDVVQTEEEDEDAPTRAIREGYELGVSLMNGGVWVVRATVFADMLRRLLVS